MIIWYKNSLYMLLYDLCCYLWNLCKMLYGWFLSVSLCKILGLVILKNYILCYMWMFFGVLWLDFNEYMLFFLDVFNSIMMLNIYFLMVLFLIGSVNNVN